MIHDCRMNDLVREGAIVLAQLGVDPGLEGVVDAQGHLPGLLPVRMMVDTGAELSFVDESFARHLGLRRVGKEPVVGVSQKPELHTVYAATLHLPINAPSPRILKLALKVAGMRENLSRTRFDGLLGRRFLGDFSLAYTGPANTFLLELLQQASV